MESQKDVDGASCPSRCSIACCNKDWTTRFCGNCGKRLRSENEGLYGLLSHIEGTMEGKRKSSETIKARIDGGTDVRQYEKDHLARELRAYAKWKSWADQLRELLERQ